MFPAYRQRLFILLAVLVSGWCYWLAGGVSASADGTDGYMLIEANTPLLALGSVVLATLVSVVLGALVSGAGNILSGVFVVGCGMLFFAWRGGGIADWLRNVTDSTAYQVLIYEAGVWLVLCVGSIWGMVKLRPILLRVIPQWMKTDSFDYYIEIAIHHLEDERGKTRSEKIECQQILETTGLSTYGANLRSSVTMITSVIVGILLSWMLMRDASVKQVTFVIMVSFMVGGMLACRIFPTRWFGLVVLAPLVSAIVVYLIMCVKQLPSDVLLERWYSGRLFRPALGMPVFWAGAGLAGSALGIGWAQALIASQLQMAGVYDEIDLDTHGKAAFEYGFEGVVGFLDAETGNPVIPLSEQMMQETFDHASFTDMDFEEKKVHTTGEGEIVEGGGA